MNFAVEIFDDRSSRWRIASDRQDMGLFDSASEASRVLLSMSRCGVRARLVRQSDGQILAATGGDD